MNVSLHLRIVGALLLLLSAAHVPIAVYLGWRKELSAVSLLTRQIFWVHSFFIALVVALLGMLSAFYTNALLVPSPLSRALLAGIVLFWLCRLLFQLFVYDPSIWRGRTFFTVMHVVFTLFWTYVVLAYAAALRSIWAVRLP